MSFTPRPFDPRLVAILAADGFGADLFHARRHTCCELVDAYVAARAVEVLGALGLTERLASPQSFDALLQPAGTATFRGALRWLLAWLVERGFLVRGTAPDTYQGAPNPPALDATTLRDEALALDPSFAPAFDLADVTAAAYPKVARGEITGERALFHRIALWVAYFSNANDYYALNNRVTARVAADGLPSGSLRILELGAGLGSATTALYEELQRRNRLGDVVAYHATEPVPFFRRRAERTLTTDWPGVPYRSTVLDIDAADWRAQAGSDDPFDLVWGVNVLHLARDLDATLAHARAALAPGGVLVVGEGIRPAVGHPVAAEFPFQLLESFSAVQLDPVARPEPGFLTAEHWLAAFDRGGFTDVQLRPDVRRLREIHSTFYAAAVSGRRA